MRILMLAHRIPYPPHTGDKVRAYHVARHLARRHALTLAFLVDDPVDLPEVASLRREVSDLDFATLSTPGRVLRSLSGLLGDRPLSLCYFDSTALRRGIERRLADERYDAIYVSSSAMAQYVPQAAGIPVVMDFVDIDSDKWAQFARTTRGLRRWVYAAEGRRLRRYEAEIARWARLCLLATSAEETLLRSFAPWARTAVIPNGVDLRVAPALAEPAAPTILFTGAMDYLPNIDAARHFCADVLPRVRRHVPHAEFLIVGLNPAPDVVRLGRLPGVRVTGAVPDVEPYYRMASVCVAPMRMARGIQNKVLQAMAMGVPIVATSCAAQGLTAGGEGALMVEDDPAVFAERVVGLLRDPVTRAAMSRRGRAFVEAHHSWDAALARLDDHLHDIVAGRVESRRLVPGLVDLAPSADGPSLGPPGRPVPGALPSRGR